MTTGNATDLRKTLVEVEDSLLVVIDIQDHFLNKYDNAKTQNLIGKVAAFVWPIHD